MPSAGMQYTQRRLQRSVTEMRRSRTVRPCVSIRVLAEFKRSSGGDAKDTPGARAGPSGGARGTAARWARAATDGPRRPRFARVRDALSAGKPCAGALQSAAMTSPEHAEAAPPPFARAPSPARDVWGWLAALSALPLVLHSLGAPLGEPVAEDFDFLHRALFGPRAQFFDGGGS